MPKTKFQNVVFTAIMAICMVYGMIVYNVALNTGGVHAETFVLALHELYIMAPVAFVLEFFVVDGLAHKLAFTFMRPDDRPQFISYAISFCICCVMCPVMSLIATVLFKEQPSFAVWVQTWGMNLPCALLWQLCYCGPFVRLIFRTFFRQKEKQKVPAGLKVQSGQAEMPQGADALLRLFCLETPLRSQPAVVFLDVDLFRQALQQDVAHHHPGQGGEIAGGQGGQA